MDSFVVQRIIWPKRWITAVCTEVWKSQFSILAPGVIPLLLRDNVAVKMQHSYLLWSETHVQQINYFNPILTVFFFPLKKINNNKARSLVINYDFIRMSHLIGLRKNVSIIGKVCLSLINTFVWIQTCYPHVL